MGLSVVTVVFLLVAVVVALGILVVVAAPHLRSRAEDQDPADDRDRRHSSRTRR